jgi:hypothetical protein
MKNFLFLLLILVSNVALAGSYNTGHGAVDQADYTTISKGTKTLSATGNQVQFFASGDNADFHILKLPDATDLPADWWLDVVNNSNGFITVRDNGNNNVASVNSSRIGLFHLQAHSTSNGTWAFNTPAAVADIITDHGQLSGLGDDDHPQYHNDARGDARYFQKTEHITTSAGAADSGKPVVLDASGKFDISMIPLGGAGDVSGPASSIDRDVVLFDGTTGKLIQDSNVSVDATGNVAAVGFTGPLNGNATTAGALDHNPSACSAGDFVTDIAADGSLTCSTPSGTGDVVGPGSATDNAITRFDGTTGKLVQNSGATIDDSGNVSATSFIGPVTGNSSTSSALASNPVDCGANSYATAIAANGDLTCATVTDSGLATSYIKADGSRGLSDDWNAGAHNITASTFIGGLTGNASTATALASNPTDCSAGQFANAIDASGNLTCATPSGSSSITYSYFYMDTGNGHGSTNTKVRRYSNIRDNIGSDFTISQSSTNGDKVAVGTAGTYVFCQGDLGASGPVHSGLVLNGANGTTDLFSVTYAQGQRTGGKTNGTNSSMGCFAAPLSANDYMWVQTNAAPDTTTTAAWFTGAKVSSASEPTIFLQNGSGHGSTATKLRTFTNARVSSGGSYLSLTQSATNGDKISVLLPAKFLICYGDGNSGGSGQGSITINDQAVTTNASSSSLINGIRTYNGGPSLAGGSTQNCYSDWLVTGDVIAFHDDGASDATDGSSYAFVTKVGATDPSMQYYTIGSSHGSTNTKARTYSKEWKRLSSSVNGTKDAVDGDTQWTGAEGIYFSCGNDQISGGTPSMGFSIKDPTTTSSTSLSYANGLRGLFTTGVNNTNSNLCVPIYLPAGGRIFAVDNGTNNSADFRSYFTTSRLY